MHSNPQILHDFHCLNRQWQKRIESLQQFWTMSFTVFGLNGDPRVQFLSSFICKKFHGARISLHCKAPVFSHDIYYPKHNTRGPNYSWSHIGNTVSVSEFWHVSFRSTQRLFQIAYEGDFRSLCTVTFWQKVDFLNSNAR